MDKPFWMASAAERQMNAPLDVQSRGRPLTEAETLFANALESVFTDGCHDFAQVATRLNELKVVAPNRGDSTWTAVSLEEELHAINSQLDVAFAEQGYGA